MIKIDLLLLPDGWRIKHIENRETVDRKDYWTVKLQQIAWPNKGCYAYGYDMEETISDCCARVRKYFIDK